ncbi:MAG TPA: prohibitin family protein [Candidatus Limnocylindria bacterium]|nr:prohibitin family protein [Candidatus Limnocylindria bacterium]
MRVILILGAIAVAGAVLAFMGSTGVVEPGHVGILTRGGVPVDEPVKPGVHRLALGESITPFDTRVQRLDYKGSAASKDLQDVVGVISLNFRVDGADVPAIFRTLGTDYQHRVIEPAVQETFKATMSQFTSNELITQRESVKRVARDLLAERLGRFRIVVEELNVLDFRFSDQFNRAIEAANAAKQAVIEEEQKLRSAQIQAQQRIAVAKADAEATLMRAQAEASANATIRSSLTPEVLEYLALHRWDGKLPQITNGTVPFIDIQRR